MLIASYFKPFSAEEEVGQIWDSGFSYCFTIYFDGHISWNDTFARPRHQEYFYFGCSGSQLCLRLDFGSLNFETVIFIVQIAWFNRLFCRLVFMTDYSPFDLFH